METWWNVDPWHELRRLQKETSRLFDDALGGRTRGFFEGGETTGRELQRGCLGGELMRGGGGVWGQMWQPRVNMKETDRELIIEAELPGLRRDEINVEITPDGMLSISGEKRDEHREDTDRYLMVERKFGRFQRQMQLPQGVDPTNIKANFTNGVLDVIIPKPAGMAGRKRIEIGERATPDIGAGESSKKRGVSGGGGSRRYW